MAKQEDIPGYEIATGTPTTDGSNGAGAIGCTKNWGSAPSTLTNGNDTPVSS